MMYFERYQNESNFSSIDGKSRKAPSVPQPKIYIIYELFFSERKKFIAQIFICKEFIAQFDTSNCRY